MQNSVLNKQGKFGVKILWRYTDMAIFVLRCFILTHPVQKIPFKIFSITHLGIKYHSIELSLKMSG